VHNPVEATTSQIINKGPILNVYRPSVDIK
jgi:hypothetical protein